MHEWESFDIILTGKALTIELMMIFFYLGTQTETSFRA